MKNVMLEWEREGENLYEKASKNKVVHKMQRDVSRSPEKTEATKARKSDCLEKRHRHSLTSALEREA